MARIRCFLLEETDRVSIKLRRYAQQTKGICPNGGYHDASFRIENEPVELDEHGYVENGTKPVSSHDDPRWPTTCTCGYIFQPDDEWQHFAERIYQRADAGEELTLRDAPVGAMWYAWWLDTMYVPQGKHVLAVKTPGGEWIVDGQSLNCGMKDDEKQEYHHCWILHGTPPDVTVSKEGAPTCHGGGGSVACNTYHGFLRDGFLVD